MARRPDIPAVSGTDEKPESDRPVFEFIAKDRQDLVDLGALLGKAWDAMRAKEMAATFTVAVNGPFNGGKSVVSDSAREYLMSTASRLAFRGEYRVDEHWYALRGSDKFEFSFANMNARPLVNDDYDATRQDILWQREFPGVAFFNNSERCRFFLPDVRIWLYEKVVNEVVSKSDLAKSFSARAKDKGERFVRVELGHARKETLSDFAEAVTEICDRQPEAPRPPGLMELDEAGFLAVKQAFRVRSGLNSLRLLQWKLSGR